VHERAIVTDRGDAGMRVDLVIRRHMADLSRATRTRVQMWIASGSVTINERIVSRVSTRVAAGDLVTVRLPQEDAPARVLPEDRPLDVVFEDEHLLIVSKPAGIVSHPTFRHPAGSLLNVLLFHARGWPASQRPSLVGRLDKETSGAVVVAKSTNAHARLQRELSSGASVKEYLAVVHGRVVPERGTIDRPLRRDTQDRRRVVTAADGAPSVTRYQLRGQLHVPPIALIRCELATGRMHQLRVHLSAAGWPIVGDKKYGGPAGREDAQSSTVARIVDTFPRQALHAHRVSFTHPFTAERLAVAAALPPDMRELVESCGWSGQIT
jgi:23S rRNA pseudouridine1911/1915/1917 synthase